MGRSLKEALLDQFALLQERGLAPSELPPEEEPPLVVVEAAPRGRSARGRRDAFERYSDADDLLGANGQFDRDRRRLPRRDHRTEDGRGERRRPPARGRGRSRPAEVDAEFALPAATPGGERRPAPPGPRPTGGPRPPRPGMGAPRPGGPRPPLSRTQILQQRAEQRRQDEQDIAEMRQLLAEYRGVEMDDAAMEAFSRALAQETGALPPPRIVVEAIKHARTADPQKIGDAVRAYYRRPRGPRSQPPAPQPVGARA